MYYLPTWKTLCRTGLKVFLHFNASMVCPSSPLSDKDKIYYYVTKREKQQIQQRVAYHCAFVKSITVMRLSIASSCSPAKKTL